MRGGYDVKYSKNIFTIHEIIGNTYKLSNGKAYRGHLLQEVKGGIEEVGEEVDELQQAKNNSRKRRLAFRETAVGHEAEEIDNEGNIILKERLRPKNEKRIRKKKKS